jgi:hypothetical protein
MKAVDLADKGERDMVVNGTVHVCMEGKHETSASLKALALDTIENSNEYKVYQNALLCNYEAGMITLEDIFNLAHIGLHSVVHENLVEEMFGHEDDEE